MFEYAQLSGVDAYKTNSGKCAHGRYLFSYDSKRDEHQSARGIPVTVYTHPITIYKKLPFFGNKIFFNKRKCNKYNRKWSFSDKLTIFLYQVFGRQQFGNNDRIAKVLHQLSRIFNIERIWYVLACHCFTTLELVP